MSAILCKFKACLHMQHPGRPDAQDPNEERAGMNEHADFLLLQMQEHMDIGIVTAIAAPAALEVKFHGDGGHAGAQLMPLR